MIVTRIFRSRPLWAPAVGVLLLVGPPAGGLAAPAADPRQLPARARSDIEALIADKATRTPVERKLDSHLVHALRQQRQQRVVPGRGAGLAALRSKADGRVLVDLRAAVQPELLARIEAAGGTVVSRQARFQTIRAWLPLDQVDALAARPEVRSIRPADEATTNVGPITSEGDVTHQAAEARAELVVDGTGIKVGVMSDSVNYLANSQDQGELPAVTVLPGQAGFGSGEGTAMLEIIHDMAPGAQLYFATAFGGVGGMAQNILDLHAAGCRVIVDDVTYYNESPFQDGPISQAVRQVTEAGTLYFSAAGNAGNFDDGTSSTWEGDFRDGGPAILGRGGRLHDFGGTTMNQMSPGTIERVDLFWNDPLGRSTNDYDIYVLDRDGAVYDSSTNVQDGDDDPYEYVPFVPYQARILVVKHSGADRYLWLSGGRAHLAISTPGGTRGHNASGASNAFCVAATWVRSPAVPFTGGTVNPVERFSSDGPRRMFFEPDGTPVTPGNYSSTGGVVLQKPDFTAADGVSTSVPGFAPFFGTSAAAPHAAAIAALLLSYNPLSPAEIRLAMESTSLDIEGQGPDRSSGAGVVMALAALRAPPIPVPRLVVHATTLTDDNGNGRPDADECADLYVTLQNLISPVGQTATNVVAQLRSLTPGVRVDPAPRLYPNILPAEMAVNPSPFRISMDPGYSCVTPVACALHVTTENAGEFNLTFNLPSTPPSHGDPLTFTSTDVPRSIPDQGTIESTVVVSNLIHQLERVRVSVHLTHSFDSDLILSLIGPDGTTVELTSNNGASGDNYGTNCTGVTVFDDSAPVSITAGVAPFRGAYRPEQPLAAFTGKLPAQANGVWTLRVRDAATEDVGILRCWSVEATPIRCLTGSGACLRPPLITAQPQDAVATNGHTARLTVMATGTEPLAYQWFADATNALTDATNATLTLPSVTEADARVYSVIVSNAFGTATSQPASLTVVSPPAIVSSPADTVATNGTQLELTVVASGTPPLAYQWFFNDSNPIAGATNATLALTAITTNQAGQYSVRVANLYGIALSPPATVDVAVTPFIARQPQNTTTTEGGTAVFAVGAGGTEPLFYQWYFNETNRLADATAPSLVLAAVTPEHAGGYSVIISNQYGTISSTEATLGVTPAALVTNAVTLVATGAVWRYLDTGVDPGTAWQSPGFDDATWASGPAQLGYGDGDEATVVNSGPNNNHYPATYFRHAFLLPAGSSYTNASLRLLRDDGAIVYLNGIEIVRNNMPAGDITFTTLASTTVSGTAETAFLSATFDSTLLQPGTNVLAVEIHQVNATSSDISFDLELQAERRVPPVILEPPVDLTVNQGDTATFHVVAYGTAPLTYQWSFEQMPILDATNATVTIPNARLVDAGAYAVTLANPVGSVTSAPAILAVSDTHVPPNVTLVQPADGAIFPADAGPIIVTATASAAPSGGILEVAFFANDILLGTSTAPPYRTVWLDAPLGLHQLHAVATDLEGGRRTSAVTHIAVHLASHAAQLVSTGAVWKYLDTGVDLGPAWRGLAFDDASWASGPAKLGYGEGNEATVVSFGPSPNSKHITTYFRSSFVLTDAASFTNVVARLLRDDGAVVYVNDVEAFRSNLPAGDITFSTLASTAVGGADESRYFTNTLSSGLLRSGLNVVAVEIHQSAANSSDLSFDLGLSGERAFAPVIFAQPTNLTAAARSRATFDVQAEGTAPLRYQWFHEETPLAGQAARTLVLDPVSSADAGRYFAVVSNDFGRVQTDTVTLSVLETNLAPTVVITSPADGSTVVASANPIAVDASATDPDGTVATVTFLADGRLLGTDSTPPFGLEWLDATAGIHSLQAIATDHLGGRGTSAPVQVTVSLTTSTARLIPAGAVWKYLDTGTNAGVAWREAAFDDSVWRSGPAELGYGDAAEGRPEATTVSFGPAANNKYITTYFRTAFVLTDAAALTNVTVRLLRDDGAAGYLNGVEVFRSNLPGGVIAYNTLATTSISGADETNFLTLPVEAGALRNGTNVFAVELHQASVSSSDLSFDLELQAERVQAPFIVAQPQNITVTNGGTAIFRVVAAGTGPLAYQWFFDQTTQLPGATNAELVLFPATPAEAGVYSVEVTGAHGHIRSDRATLDVVTGPNIPPIVSLSAPTNYARFVAGETITLHAAANDPDGTVAEVSFFADGSLLGAASTAPFEIAWLDAPLGLHVLWAVARDGAGASTVSSPVHLSVNSPSGGATSLVATGAVWKYLDDGSDQGTAWSAPAFDDSTWAAGAAELGYGDDTESRPEATVISYGNDPQNKYITYYFRHAFVADDLAPFQQLHLELLRDDGAIVYLNGTEVFRSNLPEGNVDYQTLAVAAVSLAQETQFFPTNIDPHLLVAGTNILAVEVHQVNAISSDISFDFAMQALHLSPPHIDGQPQSQTVTNGDPVSLAVNASGQEPLQYQWFFNSTNRLADATNAVLTLPAAVPSQAGSYVAEVRDAVGTTYSEPALLVVITPVPNHPPTITLTSPADGASFPEQAAIPLAASAADADGTIDRVQFFADDQLIGEVTTAPYIFDWFGAAAGNHLIQAVATDDRGATNGSTPITVTVEPAAPNPLAVTFIPAGSIWRYLDTGVDPGDGWIAPAFDDHTWASGPAELGYGDGPDGHPEATTVSFGPNANAKYPTTYFRRAFTITNAAAVTDLKLRVLRDDGVVVHLNGIEIFRDNLPGGPIVFTNLALKAIGNADETNYLEAAVAAGALVEGTNVMAVEIHQVNATSSDISFDLALSGMRPDAPVILTSPSSIALARGQTAQFTVVATGTEPLAYQWYRNALTALADATNSTLVLPNVQPTDEGSYSVVVTNAAGSARSQAAILTILDAPVIETQPRTLAVIAGDSAAFTVTAAGAPPLSYQWFYNTNIVLPSATNATLILDAVTTAQAGTYSVTISNRVGSTSSQFALLRVLVNSQILAVTRTLGVVNITFTTVPGLKYTVDWKTDLNSPAWNLVPGAVKLNGTGSPVTIQDPVPANTDRFYRVRVE